MSNPPPCERCGDRLDPDNKNSAGNYRDLCRSCRASAAYDDHEPAGDIDISHMYDDESNHSDGQSNSDTTDDGSGGDADGE